MNSYKLNETDATNRALNAFYQKVYIWYPILPPHFASTYHAAIESGSLLLLPSSSSCLVLMVAAIGSLPDVDSLHLSNRPDASYAEASLAMLPIVLVEGSLTAVQCLVLIAIYYCCLVQPIQAYDYVLIASLKIQNLLKS
jgi:hypothetical protein